MEFGRGSTTSRVSSPGATSLSTPSTTTARSLWMTGPGCLAGLAGGMGLALLYRSLASGRMGVAAPVSAVVWLGGNYHVGLGRFDQYMWPYLRADLEAGRLSSGEAEELLAEFFPDGVPGYGAAPGVTVASRARPEYDPPGVRVDSFVVASTPAAAELPERGCWAARPTGFSLASPKSSIFA